VKSISGHEVIKALTKIGFVFVKQRGSHVKLKKTTNNGKRIVIVPLHKDLPDGTLHSISRQAGLAYKEFKKLFNN
jgi:predicted RNA binding protein YcfA (HicA-like mRNA interferase family)